MPPPTEVGAGRIVLPFFHIFCLFTLPFSAAYKESEKECH